MIPPPTAPAIYATLEDGSRAGLIQKYRIQLRNGKKFYISDFITLDSFYVDIRGKEGVKRLYISQIKSLKFAGGEAEKRPVNEQTIQKEIQAKPSAPAWIKGEENKFLKKKIHSASEGPSSAPISYIPYLLILSGLLVILLCWLIIMLFRYRVLYSRKNKIRKEKKIKPTGIAGKTTSLFGALLKKSKKEKTGRLKQKRTIKKRR